MTYTFRLPFNVPSTKRIGINEPQFNFLGFNSHDFTLKSREEKTIHQSQQLWLYGDGFNSAEEARRASELSKSILRVALTQLVIPIDFGDSPQNVAAWKRYETSGVHSIRTIFDSAEVKIFKSGQENSGLIIQGLPVKMYVGTSPEKSKNAIEKSFQASVVFDQNKKLAHDLFSAAGFEGPLSTKIILLMMAVELLFKRKEREAAELKVLELLITEAQKLLPANNALIGGLSNLKTESIRSAGKRIAVKLTNQYMGMPPAEFYDYCYYCRNKIVHPDSGESSNKPPDLGAVYPQLQLFCANLICLPD